MVSQSSSGSSLFRHSSGPKFQIICLGEVRIRRIDETDAARFPKLFYLSIFPLPDDMSLLLSFLDKVNAMLGVIIEKLSKAFPNLFGPF